MIIQEDKRAILTILDQYTGDSFSNQHFSSNYLFKLYLDTYKTKYEVVDVFVDDEPDDEYCQYKGILKEISTGNYYSVIFERGCSYHYLPSRIDGYDYGRDTVELVKTRKVEKTIIAWE